MVVDTLRCHHHNSSYPRDRTARTLCLQAQLLPDMRSCSRWNYQPSGACIRTERIRKSVCITELCYSISSLYVYESAGGTGDDTDSDGLGYIKPFDLSSPN